MKKLITLASSLLSAAAILAVMAFSVGSAEAQNIGSLRNVVTPGFTFKMDLNPGDTDSDVIELQRVLNADVDTVVALTGDGSDGRETKYFGDATKSAVIKFQNKYKDVILTPAGLTAGSGKVGKLTRTKLNLLIGEFNTYDSVGTPESNRISSNSTVSSVSSSGNLSSSIASASSGVSVTVCSFISTLKNLGVISSDAATAARNTFSCVANTPAETSSSAPTVTLKVNNSSSDIEVPVNTYVTVSWTSSRASYCYTSGGTKSTSGSQKVLVDTSGTFTIYCIGAGGIASDSVSVTAVSSSNSSSSGSSADSDYSYLTPNFSSTSRQMVLVSNGRANDVAAVALSNSLKTDSALTVEAWVKPTAWAKKSSSENGAGTADAVIVSRGFLGENMDYAVSLDNGQLVYSNNDAGLWTCSAVVPLNVWTHVAVTVSESSRAVKFYVNGSEVTSVCGGERGVFSNLSSLNKAYAISNSSSVSGNVFIGNYYSRYCSMQSGTNGFIGRLDDIRIWNKVRTAAEISANMKASVKGASGLSAYWTFDNAVVSDLTGNANDGLMMGSLKVEEDNTALSAVVSSNGYNLNASSNYSLYSSCVDTSLNDSVATTTEDEDFEVGFGGVVEFVSSCGSTDNPNKYSLVVVKSFDGKTPVVGTINGSATAWQRDYGGDFGSSDPSVRLVLRHSPHTGAELPKVGDCVLGWSTGEPDTCSTTTDSQSSIEGLNGSTLEKACQSGEGFVAGGIIKKIGIDSSGSCVSNATNASSSGGGSGLIEKLGHLVGWTSIGAAWNLGGDAVSMFTGGMINIPSTGSIGGKVDKIFGW